MDPERFAAMRACRILQIATTIHTEIMLAFASKPLFDSAKRAHDHGVLDLLHGITVKSASTRKESFPSPEKCPTGLALLDCFACDFRRRNRASIAHVFAVVKSELSRNPEKFINSLVSDHGDNAIIQAFRKKLVDARLPSVKVDDDFFQDFVFSFQAIGIFTLHVRCPFAWQHVLGT